MTYSLGGTNLGVVNFESYEKNANLFALGTPGEDDSTGQTAFDFEGVTSSIRVRGSKEATTYADLKTFADSLLGFVSGTQTRLAFVSDLFGTIQVMVNSVSIERDYSSTELQINWNLLLLTANENSMGFGNV